MGGTINIYCDESCHLEHDDKPAMVLGAVWCQGERVQDIASALREAKFRHGLPPAFETKWGKVSPGKRDFYADVVSLFFDEPALRFRCVIAAKTQLQHDAFSQDHDTWYYKMYYFLLRRLLSDRGSLYRVYLDVKDTNSSAKIRKLHEVLCNYMRDFDQRVLDRVQAVHSHEVQLIQLADILTGAVSYAVRDLDTSHAKAAIVELIKVRTKRQNIVTAPWRPFGVQIVSSQVFCFLRMEAVSG
jgi:hypothetical protein